MKPDQFQKKHLVLILMPLLTIASCTRCSFPSVSPKNGELTILSYNCQNFFDDVDHGTEYIEYDPGTGEWNSDLFYKKLMNIGEVIIASVQGGPDIIAFQEVENLGVLETLRETALLGRGYREAVLIPAPDSAVNCGFISRFPVIDALSHLVSVEGFSYNRLILEVTFDCGDAPLIIFNNHWKSKSGGAEETEASRIASAAALKDRILELNKAEAGVEFVVLGDLNESVDEYARIDGDYQTALIPFGSIFPEEFTKQSILTTHTAAQASMSAVATVLFSPWELADREGSYFYNGMWETIDHVLLPSSLFDGVGWEYSSFAVMDMDFLLTDASVPKRWITGLETGYSDHLPLSLTLTLKQ